ncbi:nucleotide-diphospho-sugar transferase protein [Rippkaea orientalis PCC 8801]|uniref:Nucleotide-diphospho-sugar transferase protein n=1 Tax=Rippkaea orientalis (strain PCC 8801 / RF-1) TaxID=41431 RepID=B7K313_RIPO1|nr:Npun_R2821/Npun_R2822 family protein [Rippkaea orientalis]ACK67714.1 nucleotide-diphospho-sugar transferase protein [Rippkaea orientalis PCC 8801]
MLQGIYTLANDLVYDQLVALLNSIEVNVGKDFPVCVIPYDDRLEKVKNEIKKRKNVELLDNQTIIERWEDFARKIWNTHPFVRQKWDSEGIEDVYRLGMHRRFCAFDEESPFDEFIYFDGDVLVLNSLDYIFEQLKHNDFVVYDFQYKDPSHVFNVKSERLTQVFSQERIGKEIFCAGFYCSKKGLFSAEKRNWFIEQLQAGEAEILYPNGPDQSILNYLVMKGGISAYNFALNLSPDQKTGCSVTSPHFELRDNLLYDKGQLLTYLHYIGVPLSAFNRLCAGENLGIAYREIFLHYRYLYEPENRPSFRGKPQPYDPQPSLTQKVLNKLSQVFKIETKSS